MIDKKILNPLKFLFKNIITLIFILIILNFNLINIFGIEFYTDSNIFVNSDGSVNINSKTNYDPLKQINYTQNFTSKKGEYWILNISPNVIFRDYIFQVYLPENSQINYIKTTPNIRFENYKNRIKIIGIGENSKLKIFIQYKIKNKFNFNSINNNSILNNNYLKYIIFLFLTFIIIITFYLNKKKINLKNTFLKLFLIFNKKNNFKNKNKINLENNIDLDLFSKRQQDIINILIEMKKKNIKITQKKLELILKIPKSSVSRNIRTLELKKIIKKEKIGNTNYIFLKE